MTQVYFIRPIGMEGPIKVGCSFSPDGRRQTLDTWSPFALEVIATIEGGIDLERRFHALFVETHQRREWFGWSERLAATIAAINDGSFDVQSLPQPLYVAHRGREGKGSRACEWSPARRFACAYSSRMRALRKLGMPWSEYCNGPRFDAYAFSTGKYAHRHERPANPAARIRECEAFADKMTARHGHGKMQPVRWHGEIPAAIESALAA